LLAPAALRPALAVVAFASLAGGLWVVSLLGGVAVAASLLLGDWAEVDGAGEVDWLLGEAALALVSGVVEVALLLGAVVVLALLLGEAALALVSGVVEVALLGAVVVLALLLGEAALALVSGVVEVALLGAVVVLALLLGEAALALVSGVVEVALLLGAVVVLDWLMLDVSLELFEGVFAADDGGVVAPAAPVELEPQ